jgi:DNA-binding NtrC family response regulator
VDKAKRPTVLIVDDEPSVLSLAQMALEEDGYETVLASRGSEALAACERPEPVIDVVVVDVVMPGMSGPDLAERLKESLPHAKLIFTSGYGDGAGLALRKREPDATYLKKPFSPDALCQAVASVLGR